MLFLKLIRVHDWIKSFFVLLGPIYGRHWTSLFNQGLVAALSFCFIASAVYVFNDWYDLEADERHPRKSKRPLAQGLISVHQALIVMGLCLVAGLVLAWSLSLILLAVMLAYLSINLFYNLYGKHIPYIDVLCIASGFMLRILAGTIGIGIPVSKWLLLCGTLVSLNLALSKRYLEMRYVGVNNTRLVLARYSQQGLLITLRLVALGVVISYSFYCFNMVTMGILSNWIFATLPCGVFAYWRLDFLLRQQVSNDNPVNVLLCDNYSLFNACLFFILTVVVLL